MNATVERKLDVLAAVLDNPNLHVKSANDEGLVFAASDNRIVNGAQTCPVFVILSDAEQKAEHPEKLEQLEKTYAGYKAYEHRGEKFHLYSGYFAN